MRVKIGMADNKRIYSLNLITYINLVTDLMPQIKTEDGVTFYAIFPFCNGVSVAIDQYRNSKVAVDLHEFISRYKQIRRLIKQKRGDSSGTT